MPTDLWAILPTWLSLLVLLVLAIITWWYARSTSDMARIMKETYEAETSPQLGCAIANVMRTLRLPTQMDISFELKFTNAGKYALGIKSIQLVGEVQTQKLNYPILLPAGTVLLAPNKDYPVSWNVTVPDKVQNLKIKVDFDDFKGRSHSKEFPLPQ